MKPKGAYYEHSTESGENQDESKKELSVGYFALRYRNNLTI